MTICNISQAKAQLSALLEQVSRGEDIILTKAGKPVAKLIPYGGPVQARQPGSMEGKIWISPDFDSLPEDMAEAFGMLPE